MAYMQNSTVAQLPTAAAKKVRQSPSRTCAADRKALLRFPDIYKTDAERRADDSAAVLAEIEQTPAFAMAVAIFQTLSETDKLRVQVVLAALSGRSSGKSALQALEYAQFVTAAPSTRAAISRALDARFEEQGR